MAASDGKLPRSEDRQTGAGARTMHSTPADAASGNVPYPVDLSLFEGTSHSPSFLSLQRSMRRPDLELHDFCIPVNPYFPTPGMFDVLRSRLDSALKYYPATNAQISGVLAGTLGLDPEAVVVANGSTELITWIDLLLVRESLATPIPTFGRWTDHPQELGRRLHCFPLRSQAHFELDLDEFVAFVRQTGARTVAVCNPNNPTGALLTRTQAVYLLDALADLDLIVIDESFIDFADPEVIPTVSDEAVERENVIVLKSLGKNFGLHGIRAGYAVANPRLAAVLRSNLPHWNVNGMAEMLIGMLGDHWSMYEESRRRVIYDRMLLEDRLRLVPGLTVFPSHANFVYVELPAVADGVALRNLLLRGFGVLVRDCGNKLGSGPQFLRIAARPEAEINLLIRSLESALEGLSPRASSEGTKGYYHQEVPLLSRRGQLPVAARV